MTLRNDSENKGNTNSQDSRQKKVPQENVGDTATELVQTLLECITRICNQLKKFGTYLMVDLGGREVLDQSFQWCARNPKLTIFILAGFISILLPFLVILGFGISTILMTILGFLVIEGTILSVISVMLFGCVGALILILFSLIAICATAAFGFVRISSTLNTRA